MSRPCTIAINEIFLAGEKAHDWNVDFIKHTSSRQESPDNNGIGIKNYDTYKLTSQVVLVKCKEGYLNLGGRAAVCRDGVLEIDSSPPNCVRTGKCFKFLIVFYLIRFKYTTGTYIFKSIL